MAQNLIYKLRGEIFMRSHKEILNFKENFFKSWVGNVPKQVSCMINEINGKDKSGSFNVNLIKNRGTLLHHIIDTDKMQPEAIKVCIDYGIDVNFGEISPLCFAIGKYQKTGSFVAYHYAHLIVENGADVNKVTSKNETPFKMILKCIQNSDHLELIDVANLLYSMFKKGLKLELNKDDHFDISFLSSMVSAMKFTINGNENDDEIVRMLNEISILLENNFTLQMKNARESVTRLEYDLKDYRTVPFDYFIPAYNKIQSIVSEKGRFDINTGDCPLLCYAICYGQVSVIRILLQQYSANINVQVNKESKSELGYVFKVGETPLHCAIYNWLDPESRCELFLFNFPPPPAGKGYEMIINNAAYVLYENNQLYYLNKEKKIHVKIPLTSEQLDHFIAECKIDVFWYENRTKLSRRLLSKDELKQITIITGHSHDDGWKSIISLLLKDGSVRVDIRDKTSFSPLDLAKQQLDKGNFELMNLLASHPNPIVRANCKGHVEGFYTAPTLLELTFFAVKDKIEQFKEKIPLDLYDKLIETKYT